MNLPCALPVYERLIACGGTGGHLFPGLAVAETLRDARPRGDVVCLGKGDRFPGSFGTGAISIREAAHHRFALALFACHFRIRPPISIKVSPSAAPFIAISIRRPCSGWADLLPPLRSWPDGCAAFPLLFTNRTPIPGKANRMTARMVRAVLLGFKECAQFFPKVRTEFTGTPIRPELNRSTGSRAGKSSGSREDLATLLVMGGSQGASGINQAIIKSLPFPARPSSADHSSFRGARRASGGRQLSAAKIFPAYVSAFHHRMEEVYSAADFAVARSGAASLAEFAAFGLPAF